MEVILIQDVNKVGRKGDVVRVRDGFGRNFLLPRSLAIPSTRANQQFVEEQKLRAATRREKDKAEAQGVAERLSKVKVSIPAQAGEQEKLFGSVTAEDIAESLTKQGFAIDRKHIQLKEPIRSLGTFTVTVEIFPQVKATVPVEVVKA